jgi:2-keto-4-pentenoate hydratase/2-oxohepta-3-ene-1,7-dioic acid hydratase in catechol pathway
VTKAVGGSENALSGEPTFTRPRRPHTKNHVLFGGGKNMPTRRSFFQGVGLTAIAAMTPDPLNAAQSKESILPNSEPEEMPRGLTLLAMKQSDGAETLGLKTPAGVLDVAKANAILNRHAPVTLEELLRSGDAGALNAFAKEADASTLQTAMVNKSEITYGRLFTNPGKIICVGLNYRTHAQETGMVLPKAPILFNKYNNALASHNATIKLPPREVSYKFDYETELLIVIGKKARNVSETKALDYVAGYAIGHDFSARDLQMETGGQWMVGKTLDGFAPIGPYFVSADLVGDPNNLAIETRVNGEIRQSDNTKNFIFNAQTMIAYISRLFALEPGDIIFTGTPSGVILGMPKEKQVWLKSGDRIESSIEKLGVLKFDLA